MPTNLCPTRLVEIVLQVVMVHLHGLRALLPLHLVVVQRVVAHVGLRLRHLEVAVEQEQEEVAAAVSVVDLCPSQA